MPIANTERNAAIIADAGTLSLGLIAKKHGVTRNTVAGVIFRNRHPKPLRRVHPNGVTSGGMTGKGYRRGKRAPEHLPLLGRPSP